MFRQANIDDLHEITTWIRSRQDCELWAGPYLPWPLDPELLPVDIDLYRVDSVVLVEEGRLLGFGQLLEKDRASGHLARLIVNPDQRRRGHGSRLVTELLHKARRKGYREVTLNVDRDNRAARTLYESLGFRHAERPAGEFASPRSRYMRLDLA